MLNLHPGIKNILCDLPIHPCAWVNQMLNQCMVKSQITLYPDANITSIKLLQNPLLNDGIRIASSYQAISVV